jgi:hypothetical protein
MIRSFRLASRTRFSMAWAYEPPVLSSLTCLFASSKMFSRCSFRAWRTFRREALSAVDWELREERGSDGDAGRGKDMGEDEDEGAIQDWDT